METNKNFKYELTKTPIKDAFLLSSQIFDSTHGGFGNAPKFPLSHNLMFLSRFGVNENMINPLEMVEKTLNSMFKGGFYDHIGYGFFNYSTDESWLIPNFEKKLNDNALLLISYLEAYEQTKNPLYKNICINTFDYILTELINDSDIFYSGEYASEDDVYGKFYLFNSNEIINLLGNEDGSYFNNYYGISNEGNFEGFNILNLLNNYTYNKEDDKINYLRTKVFQYRNSRANLIKDKEISTAKNSLIIIALAKGYKVLNNEKYLSSAIKALNFIKGNLINNEGKLLSKVSDITSNSLASLDDYAFLVWALIELYNSTFDIKYLKEALDFNKTMINLFWDKENYGFFLNSFDSINITDNIKDTYDGKFPSGNSVAAYNLVKLYKLTGNSQLNEYALNQLTVFYEKVKEIPIDYCFYLIALMSILYPSKELIIISKDNNDIEELRNILKNKFTPNLTIIVKTKENKKELENLVPFVKNLSLINDMTTYYIYSDGDFISSSNNLSDLEIIYN